MWVGKRVKFNAMVLGELSTETKSESRKRMRGEGMNTEYSLAPTDRYSLLVRPIYSAEKNLGYENPLPFSVSPTVGFSLTSRERKDIQYPLPVTVGRRSLCQLWWDQCPHHCRVKNPLRLDSSRRPCNFCRIPLKQGRWLELSSEMIRWEADGSYLVTAKHSDLVQLIQKKPNDPKVAKQYVLFIGDNHWKSPHEGSRGPKIPFHKMVFEMLIIVKQRVVTPDFNSKTSQQAMLDHSSNWLERQKNLQTADSRTVSCRKKLFLSGKKDETDSCSPCFSPNPDLVFSHSNIHSRINGSEQRLSSELWNNSNSRSPPRRQNRDASSFNLSCGRRSELKGLNEQSQQDQRALCSKRFHVNEQCPSDGGAHHESFPATDDGQYSSSLEQSTQPWERTMRSEERSMGPQNTQNDKVRHRPSGSASSLSTTLSLPGMNLEAGKVQESTSKKTILEDMRHRFLSVSVVAPGYSYKRAILDLILRRNGLRGLLVGADGDIHDSPCPDPEKNTREPLWLPSILGNQQVYGVNTAGAIYSLEKFIFANECDEVFGGAKRDMKPP